jgi:DnaJ-class molecular chaperone
VVTSADDTKDCPRCSGRGKYADPQRGPLVQIKCERCEGSGRVPADSPDEPPAKEPTQIPFGSGPS